MTSPVRKIKSWFGRIRPVAMLSAGALVAPVVAVQGVRLLLGTGGPTQVSAATGQVSAPAAPVAVPAAQETLTPKQLALAAWLQQQRDVVVKHSPLARPLPPALPTQSPAMTVVPAPNVEQPVEAATAQIPEAIRALKLSGLARSTTTGAARAIINGRAVPVGERVVAGWVLTEIDIEARRLTLRGPDGLEIYLNQVD